MKFRGPIFFSILIIGLLVAAYYPKAEDSQKEAVLLQTILNGFGQLHYRPKPVDDDFSKEVYDLYLDRLDGGHRFLTQKDMDQLQAYQLELDDEARAGNFEFFDRSMALLDAATQKVRGYYREALAQPFDYTVDESFELDGEKRGYAKDDAALKEFWHKYAKYQTLQRLSDKLQEQKEEKGEEVKAKSFEQLEQDAREGALKYFDDWFTRLGKLKREDRLSIYLNAITQIFDPHSEYLQPIEKENFDINFSGRLEGIGASLLSEGDYTKVARVIVGGPAWKQKELAEDDIILKVKQESEKDPVDITGMVLNDVVQLIRGKKDTKVTLTIKKVDGTVKDITIVRDVVIVDEQFAKSLILGGDKPDEKVGYIYLPGFYADFENSNGRFCSKDVANEIAKLEAENVKGIILDLRYNGGGALNDAVKMTGFFIESGPIVQLKSRDRSAEVLRDVDPRVQYDGPLIVMVNSYSASASEILAAALQDYGRAVIVGSTSTFGKGTAQNFVDLDRTIRGFNELKPLGDIKITTQKFYRINGGSTQLKGVIPDIVLPDNFYYIKTGERDREYAMEWTEIEPVNYSQNVFRASHLNELKKLSEARVAKSEIFQKILDNAKRLEELREESEYPLNLQAYEKITEEQEAESARFDNMFDKAVNPNVANLGVDLPDINIDDSRKARNEEWIKSISKDVYLQETLHIMHDLIALQ
ncbi:MAG: carboxy terminal-processing peptidase [Phaeodactylibacter sp.]|nr:carboxy terminal-processing peptidase [Phaeodactylibacter sp.]MCB9276744.1 carboxy terminal-processing peptidase [Lewinellaceae bacterium]